MKKIEVEDTERGFARGEFVDRYGSKCSIQKSSLATEDCIWLGVSNLELKVLRPGKRWRDVGEEVLEELLGGQICASTRMHLTQDDVRKLLPLLQHFVDTGELP